MSETRQEKLVRLKEEIARRCVQIERLFDRAHRDEVRVTVVVRTPWLGLDGGVLVTNDDIDAAVAEIERLRVRPEVL